MALQDAEGPLAGGALGAFPQLALQAGETTSLIGERVGPYRVVEELGTGGMGAVFLAERADGQYESRVAIKLLRPGPDQHVFLRRFFAERQFLATLIHPGIARLYDGGVASDGCPWFAMEYIDGTPIDVFCNTRTLSIRDRLELFMKASDAVSYAHRNLVIHRDLKPSHILIDASSNVHLLDFGIAKLISSGGGGGETTETFRAFTPSYASPEQIRGEQVSTATDIYSLGVILFKVLTGEHPYAQVAHDPYALSRAILEQEPPNPSAVVSQRNVPNTSTSEAALRRLRARLKGDLDMIVLTAMHKHADRRYHTVDAFSADLRRYLDGVPVLARPDTRSYRAMRYVLRHPWGMLSFAAIALLLIGWGVTTYRQLNRVRHERAMAEAVSNFLIDVLQPENAMRGESMTVRQVLDESAQQLKRDHGIEPEIRARLFHLFALSYGNLQLIDLAREALDSAISIRRRSGADPLTLIRDLEESGNLWAQQGRVDLGMTTVREALSLRRQLYGSASYELAEGLMHLG